MTFSQWMKQVDKEIDKLCGLSHMDIGDQTWHDWFDDGLPAKEAAEMALEDEGFPVGWD